MFAFRLHCRRFNNHKLLGYYIFCLFYFLTNANLCTPIRNVFNREMDGWILVFRKAYPISNDIVVEVLVLAAYILWIKKGLLPNNDNKINNLSSWLLPSHFSLFIYLNINIFDLKFNLIKFNNIVLC